MIDTTEAIEELLGQEFMLSATRIARTLGLDRSHVNRALHEGEGRRFLKVSGSHEWSLMPREAVTEPVVQHATMPAHAPVWAVGSVVRWRGGVGEDIGVVTADDGAKVEVTFDDGATHWFASVDAPLENVDLGTQVVRRSTGEPGFLTEGPSGAPPVCKVVFTASGKFLPKSVPMADLRPHVPVSPVERMKAGRVSDPRRSNLAIITRLFDIEHRTNELVSLSQARVDLKPHQVAVVHRVVSGYPHRFLLCDEVGLGKTIEAGTIIKELRARGQARRTLVVVPPNLVRQWQFELRTKFNETFSVLNSATVRYLRDSGYDGNPFGWSDSVIVSSNWLTHDKERAIAAAQVDWDMVVVDEAHHARTYRQGRDVRTTNLYKAVRELAAPADFSNRAILLLTATPMQLGTDELHGLVDLLDPSLFPSREHFETHRQRVPGLNKLVDDLQRHGFPLPDVDPATTVRQVSTWLDAPTADVQRTLSDGSEAVAQVCDALSRRHRLSEIMIRNRKSVVGGFMPRHATRWAVDLGEDERTALDAVQAYVDRGWEEVDRTGDNATGFLLTVFQKLMASSIWALRESLRGRLERLESNTTIRLSSEARTALEEDATLDDVVAARSTRGGAEVAELKRLVKQLTTISLDSKAETLLRELRQVFTSAVMDAHEGCPTPASHRKVLVFTEFRKTLEYLHGLLSAEGWQVEQFHGQLSAEQKDRAVESFRTATGPSVLLSTEAGGEGRNFQFCHMLVNYDLPWNPMRVEQRIGRVDRLGQDHPVQVFNLWVQGTIEERVLDVLERRISLFEDTVGGLDPILGETEKGLVAALRSGDAGKAMDDLGSRLERDVRQARLAESQLRDLIMDTKSFSREIVERITGTESPITPEDQARLVKELLADVNTWIGPEVGGERQIVFHEPFLSDHREFTKDGRERRIVLRADDQVDSELVDYMTFGHPIVEVLKDGVLDETYEGNASARLMPTRDELPTARGWLAVHVLRIAGLRTIERLLPVFVHDDLTVDMGLGEAVLDRMRGLDSRDETALELDTADIDLVDVVVERAEASVRTEAAALRDEAHESFAEQAARERQKLEDYYAYRERAAADRVQATAATLERLRTSDLASDQKVVALWTSNLERDRRVQATVHREREARLEQIATRLRPEPDWSLTALVRIVIDDR